MSTSMNMEIVTSMNMGTVMITSTKRSTIMVSMQTWSSVRTRTVTWSLMATTLIIFIKRTSLLKRLQQQRQLWQVRKKSPRDSHWQMMSLAILAMPQMRKRSSTSARPTASLVRPLRFPMVSLSLTIQTKNTIRPTSTHMPFVRNMSGFRLRRVILN